MLHRIKKTAESELCSSSRSMIMDSYRPILYHYWDEERRDPMELHLIANLFLVILEKSPEDDQIELVSTALGRTRPESNQFLIASP